MLFAKRQRIEIIPIYRTTICFDIIELMRGVTIWNIEIPLEWPKTIDDRESENAESANVCLVIDWQLILTSKHYSKSSMTSADILNAFYLYSFLRSDLIVDNAIYNNARYVVRKEENKSPTDCILMRSDTMLKIEAGHPIQSQLLSFDTDEEYFNALMDGSGSLGYYLKLMECGLPSSPAYENNAVGLFTDSLFLTFRSDERNPSLQVITIFTILEALFSKNGSEVMFKLGHNLSFFIYPHENQYEDRHLFFNRYYSKLYNYRSSAAHGSAFVTEDDLNFYKCMELLRKVLRVLLEKFGMPDVFYTQKNRMKFIDYLQIGHLGLRVTVKNSEFCNETMQQWLDRMEAKLVKIRQIRKKQYESLSNDEKKALYEFYKQYL